MASKGETNQWVRFFQQAGLPAEVSVNYALTFAENRIKKDMLMDLNKEYLKEMGITLMGDVISILKHSRQVYEEEARSNVLKSSQVTQSTFKNTAVQVEKPTLKKVTAVAATPVLEAYGPKEPPTPVEVPKPVAKAVVVKNKPAEVARNLPQQFDEYSEEEPSPPPPPPVRKLAIKKVVPSQSTVKRVPQPSSTVPAKKVVVKSRVQQALKQPVQVVSDEYEQDEYEEVPRKKVRRVLPEHEGPYRVIMPSGTTPRTQKILAEKSVSASALKKTVFDRLGDCSVSSTTGISSSDEGRKFTVTGIGSSMVRSASNPTFEKVTSLKFNSSVFSRLGKKSGTTGSSLQQNEDSDEEKPAIIQRPKQFLVSGLKTKSIAPSRGILLRNKVVEIAKNSPTLKSDLPQPAVQHRLGITSTTSAMQPARKTVMKQISRPAASAMKPGSLASKVAGKTVLRSTVSPSILAGLKARGRIGTPSLVRPLKINILPSSNNVSVTSSSPKSGGVFSRLGM